MNIKLSVLTFSVCLEKYIFLSGYKKKGKSFHSAVHIHVFKLKLNLERET